MALENPVRKQEETNGKKHGRIVVFRKEELPGTNGRAIVFYEEFRSNTEPVIPEIETSILNNLSSENIRSVVAEAIAETKGEKPPQPDK